MVRREMRGWQREDNFFGINICTIGNLHYIAAYPRAGCAGRINGKLSLKCATTYPTISASDEDNSAGQPHKAPSGAAGAGDYVRIEWVNRRSVNIYTPPKARTFEARKILRWR